MVEVEIRQTRSPESKEMRTTSELERKTDEDLKLICMDPTSLLDFHRYNDPNP
jgi:hypothetical protein